MTMRVACSRRSASPGRRRAGWRTSSTRWPGRWAACRAPERTWTAPVDVFLPRYRSVPVPADRGGRARPADRRPGPQPARGLDRRLDRRRRGGRLPAAPRGRHPPPSIATPSTATALPTTRGGSPSSAARRWRRCAAMAGARRPAHPRLAHGSGAHRARPSGPGEGRLPGPAAVVVTLHNLAYHGWTANDAHRPAGPAPGGAARRPQPVRHRPPAHGDPGLRDREHGLARLRARGADPRVRHGPRRRRCAPKATGSSGSSTASTRTSGTRPATRRSPCRIRGPPRRARRPAGGTCSGASASTPTTTASCSG